MIHLKPFNEAEETKTFKNTNQDIKMFFTDYTDENHDALTIEDVLLCGNDLVEKTSYMKNTSKYRRAKIVKLVVTKSNGISTRNGHCLKSFDILKDVVSDIERFYEVSGEEINYTINMEYDELVVRFIVLGDMVKAEESDVKKIDDHFIELKKIMLKRYGETSRRIKISGNWFEIKVPKSLGRDATYCISMMFHKIISGQINLDNTPESQESPYTTHKREIIQWRNSVYEDGFEIETSGGDQQLVLKLKKRN